jgi:hypothetical protein
VAEAGNLPNRWAGPADRPVVGRVAGGRDGTGQYGAGVDWLTAIALPVGGIIGGLVGAWWARRASKTAEIGSLLNAQLEALYSEHPRQRQAARDIIRGLMTSGSLSAEQLEAASTALRHWAAVNWDAPGGAGRTLESSEETSRKEASDG